VAFERGLLEDFHDSLDKRLLQDLPYPLDRRLLDDFLAGPRQEVSERILSCCLDRGSLKEIVDFGVCLDRQRTKQLDFCVISGVRGNN
jgi:hypothetical protein